MLEKSIKLFIFLFFFIFFMLYFLFESLNLEMFLKRNLTTTAPLFNKSAPLILFFTKIFGQKSIAYDFDLKNCLIKCQVSDNPM